jgi:CDP-diacylglycerol--glycerol-3-phosphate 3-phosphatidyltransferase
MSGRIWTISNVLSLLRIILVLPIALLTLEQEPSHRLLAVGLILLAASTDLLDGLFARKFGQVTDLGKVIDPLADKVAVGVIIVLLAKAGMVPVWFVVATLARDGAILLGGVYVRRRRGILLQSNTLGKWTVTFVAAYLLLALLGGLIPSGIEEIFLFTSTAMLIASFFSYAKRLIDVLMKSSAEISGSPKN